MTLIKTYFRVNVSETEKDRNYWASREGLTPETIYEIRTADILLVPWENRGKIESIAFPGGTTDFFRSLSREFGKDSVAIAIDRENYCELALHSYEQRWPTIIVSTVLLGALANVLAAEVEKLISKPSPPTMIEMSITVENDRGKCISIDYNGPPSWFVDTLVQEAERCFPRSFESQEPSQSEDPKSLTSSNEGPE